MVANFRNTWQVSRIISNNPFVQDDDWQDPQDVAGFVANSGALLLIAKPNDIGRMELAVELLDASNELVSPGKNSKVRIQQMEGIGLGEIDSQLAPTIIPTTQAANPTIKARPFITNVGAEFDIKAEEPVFNEFALRARMFIGIRAISVSGIPGGTETIVIMSRFS